MILNVHHVGIVVKDIPEVAERYARRYGYLTRSDIMHDPIQTAFVQFLQIPGDPVFIELVSPDREGSKLSNSLAKGGGLNHICYATTNIDEACRQLRSEQMMLLQAPVKAVAFPDRRIAWLMGVDRTPIELVERGLPGDL